MNTHAGIQYPFTHAPSFGAPFLVAPGIYWLRMPLPFALSHINLWLIEDGNGFVLVDTGVNTDPVRVVWYKLFSELLRTRPIQRIVVTHHHPDHVGLAAWLSSETGAPVFMSRTEWLYAHFLDVDVSVDRKFAEEMVEFYRDAAAPIDFLGHVLANGPAYSPLVDSIPNCITRLADGDSIEIGGSAWRVIVGQGHSPEHLCFFCEERGVFISGDQVLPRISPNVGVESWEPLDNPLRDFLQSLDKLEQLPQSTLTLPSHGLPFLGLHARLATLKEHHHERLAVLQTYCSDSRTAMELTSLLFRRSLDLHQMSFAICETLAHIRYLEEAGVVSRLSSPGGPTLFRRQTLGGTNDIDESRR